MCREGLRRAGFPRPYDRLQIIHLRSKLMNTIIYIVGLVVVIGIIMSFFGLR